MSIRKPAAMMLVFAAVAGCSHRGEIDTTSGVGIASVRTACPTVGIPAGTGDVTLFDPPASTDQSAVDVVATMTHVRSTCAGEADPVATTVTFDVEATRMRTDAARDVTLPYFIVVVQGGSNVVAERVAQVSVHFDAGQARATGSGQATSYVNRSAATLPADIRKKLTERRKAGDEDAAVDPLTRPEIRDAVLRSTFEALVGFQLTDAQLKYNAQR